MNRIFKVIWSKAKNCYVVASELAKSHTKAPKSGVMSRALVAGVLACVLSCGVVMPSAFADRVIDNYSGTISGDLSATNYVVPASNLLGYPISVIVSSSGEFMEFPLIYDDSHVGSFTSNVKNVIASILNLPLSELHFDSCEVTAKVSSLLNPVTGTQLNYHPSLAGMSSGFTFGKHGDYFYLGRAELPQKYIYSGNFPINVGMFFSPAVIDQDVANAGYKITVLNDSGSLAINNSNFSVTGDVSANSITSTNSTFSANSIKTTSGDIAASTSNLTATNSIESAGAINAISNSTVSSGSTMTTPVLTASGSTVSSSDSINVTGGVADGGDTVGVSLSNGSTLTSTNDTTVTNTLKLADASTVSTGGTLSAKSIKGTGENTITADKVVTTNGDIDASDSSVTATDSVETTGVVKLRTLNAPMLRGTGAGMSTLGGGLTVAGQVKGVTAGTDDNDAVNLGQLNAALTNVVTTDSVYQDDNYNVFVYGDKYSSQNQSYHYNTNINAILGLWMTSGDNSYTQGASESVAIGHGTIVAGNRNIGIGNVDIRQYYGNPVQSKETSQSVVIGYGSKIQGSSNSIVLGPYASVVGNDNSIALGYASQASGENAIALGSRSIADVANTVSVGSYYLNRRIVNVADGIDDTDAVTLGQMQTYTTPSENGNYVMSDKTGAENLVALDGQLKTTTDSLAALGDSSVLYDGTDKSTITLAGGESGTVIANVKAGTLSADSTEAVNGSQLFTTNTNLSNESTARSEADTALGIRIDDVITAYGAADTALGTRIDDEAAARQAAVTTLQGTLSSLSGNAVLYAGEDKSVITLGGTEGTTISNVKAGTLSATSTEAVTGSQLFTTNTNLANETTARETADTALGGRIDTEITDRTNADTVLDNKIAAETTARENAISQLTQSISDLGGNAVQYDSMDKSAITLGGGESGTVIANVKAGTLSATSTEAVNGSQLYSTNQALAQEVTDRTTAVSNEAAARESADTALDGRIGVIAEDGEYIKKSSTNSIAANLSILDLRMKANADDISGLKDLSNITGSGETVIRNLAKGSVKVASGNYTNIVKGTDGNADSYTVNVIANGEAAEGNTGLMTGGAVYTAVKGAVDAFSPANISDAAAAQWAERLGTGVVAQDSTGLVSGKTLYNEVHVSDGNVVRAANTVGQNLAALDAGLKTVGTDVADIKENALKYDDSGKTAVTLGDGTNAAAIHNLAAGELSAASKDAVNGSQLYSVRDKLQKADGIDKGKWQEVLGDGKVELDNTGLVTGDTVYKAIVDSSTAASVRMVGINSKDSTDTNYTGGGATGENAIAIGSGVEVSGDNAVAMGKDSRAGGAQSVAIGHGSQALGLQSVVIGTSNKVTGNHSGAFGDPNYVTGDNSYAFGNNNSVSGSNTFVLGNNVKASGKNSVVLGAGSDGSEDNVVSVGAKGNERRIAHVADGQTMTDAATVGQLSRLAQAADNGLRYLDCRVNKAGAGAAALAALHPLDMDGKFGMAAGYGNYHSTHAMALGLFYQPKDNVMFSIGGTIGNGDNMINAGVSIALDKGFTNSKAAMARNIRNLTAENAAMKEKLEAQGNEIKELKEMLMQLKSQMQKQ